MIKKPINNFHEENKKSGGIHAISYWEGSHNNRADLWGRDS